jgi:hypothetical protein
VSVRLAEVFVSLSLLSITLFGADADPFVGTWKLHWEKSHSAQPRPKRAVRRYQQSGDGVRVHETWEYSDGKQETVDYTAKYDGNEYPVPTKEGVTVAFTRPDRYTVTGVTRSNGKTEFTCKRHVSKDGNTLTIEKYSVGESTTEVLVYDRMK